MAKFMKPPYNFPGLRHHLHVIGTNCDWTAAPVIKGNTLLVCGCGQVCKERAGLGRSELLPVPILEAIDLQSGHSKFRIDRTGPEGMEIVTSCPRFCEDGTIFLSVYEHNKALSLLRVAADGTVLLDQVMETGHPFVAWDAGSKLMMTLEPDSRDRFFLSWSYRQVRQFGTSLRRCDESPPVWVVTERLIGLDGDYFVCVETPNDGGHIVGRSKSDSAKVWSLEIPHGTISAAGAGCVTIVDTSRKELEKKSATQRMETEAAKKIESGKISDANARLLLDEILQFIPTEPVTLRVYGIGSGRELWAADIPGDILDVKQAKGVIAVLSSMPDGQGTRWAFDMEGKLLGKFEISGRSIDRWPMENDDFRIITISEDHLLWANRDTLFFHRLRSSTLEWRFTLPSPCIGFRTQISERMLPLANVAIQDEVLALRDGPEVWIYDL